MRVVRRKLLVHPIEVENTVDLARKMVRWHNLVEFKGIKELALSAFPPTHHEPLPPMPSQPTESSFVSRLTGSFATQSGAKRTFGNPAGTR